MDRRLPSEPELLEISRARDLTYPIVTKGEFVAQMTSSDEPLTFRGMSYDPEFAAELIPDFFFPVESEQDLLTKTTELLIARGLLAVPAAGEERGARAP